MKQERDAEDDATLATPETTIDRPRRVHSDSVTNLRGVRGLGDLLAGRYRLETELGAGGFGSVYAAFDELLQRRVAVKLLRVATLSVDDKVAQAEARHQLLTEARLAASLLHPNVVAVFDVGEADEDVFIVQELVAGQTVKQMLQSANGGLPVKQAVLLARQVAEGLGAAHARGIVHRDVKPANVIVDTAGGVKVADFGISARPGGPSTPDRIAGTPGYMAPEQLQGQAPDFRADVFSLGCVLYEMLTGRKAFEGDTTASVFAKTLQAEPPGPSRIRAELPQSLDRIVARALRKTPERRYPTMAALAAELSGFEDLESVRDADGALAPLGPALWSGDCALLLGSHLASAGESRGDTVERRLAVELATHLRRPVEWTGLPRVAQELEAEQGREELVRRLAVALREAGRSPGDLVRAVARLPFRAVLTTSYDNALERELEKAGKPFVCMEHTAADPAPTQGPLIAHLLGSVAAPEHLVVTEDDLWALVTRVAEWPDRLRAALQVRHLVVVGFDAGSEQFRQLTAAIDRTRLREGAVWLLLPEASVAEVRWAERRRYAVVDSEPVAFLQALEQRLAETRPQERLDRPKRASVASSRRPYKCLDAFEAEDEDLFFGREAEIERLADKVRSRTLVVLHAPSGSGKTSLLQAGLLPRLKRTGVVAVSCRVFDEPVNEVARALETGLGLRLDRSGDPASQVVSCVLEQDRTVVLALDQFEELFTRHAADVRARFQGLLYRLVTEGRGRVRVLLSLREDYLSRLAEMQEAFPGILHNELRLPRLGAEAARAAIVEPARRAAIEVEDQLVQRLLQDLDRAGVEPPQLQIVCDCLYDATEGDDRRLTLAAYDKLGGARGILGGYLERVVHASPPEERESLRNVLKAMVTAELTKSVTRLGSLSAACGVPEADLRVILDGLQRRRVVRIIDREDGTWYELSHEYLVDEIARWVSAEDKEIKKLRELVEQAMRSHAQLGLLMSKHQLDILDGRERELGLPVEALNLIRQSRAALDAQRRRLTRLAVAAGLVATFGLLGGRAAFLYTGRFAVADRRVLASEGGTVTSAPIGIWRGRASAWPIDPLLGFPKRLADTSFVADDVRPNHPLRSAPFDLPDDTPDEVFKLLAPAAQVRELAIRNDPGTARLLETVLGDPTTTFEQLEAAAIVAAASGHMPVDLWPRLLAVLERLAQQTNSRADRGWGARANSRDLSVPALLGATDRAALVRVAEGHALRTRSDWPWDVLALDGGAEARAAERRLQHNMGLEALMQTPLQWMGSCPSRLDYIERRRLAGTPLGDLETAFIAAQCSSDPGRLRAALLVAVREWLRTRESSAQYRVRFIVSRAALFIPKEASEAMRSLWDVPYVFVDSRLVRIAHDLVVPEDRLSAVARAQFVSLRARAGSPEGLLAAWAAVREVSASSNSPLTDARAVLLQALALYRGPAVRRVLDEALGVEKDPRLISGVVAALRWYPDAQNRERLWRLATENVRLGADATLARIGTPEVREEALRLATSEELPARVAGALVLLRMQESVGIGALKETVGRILRLSPVPEDLLSRAAGALQLELVRAEPEAIMELLRSPEVAFRVAAAGAAMDHPRRAELGRLLERAGVHDPWGELARTAWVLRIVERAEEFGFEAAVALDKGETERAQRLFEAAKVAGILTTGLGPHAGDVMHRLPDKDAAILDARLAFDAGRLFGFGTWIPTSDVLRALQEAPSLAAAREIYHFRVVIGMESPKELGDASAR